MLLAADDDNALLLLTVAVAENCARSSCSCLLVAASNGHVGIVKVGPGTGRERGTWAWCAGRDGTQHVMQ